MDRKELIRRYKETPTPAGVFRVLNQSSGRSLVGSSPNLPGMLNRQRFQLEHGSHPIRELQGDWNELGADAFTFETLDELDQEAKSPSAVAEELEVLEQLWRDKLLSEGASFYGSPKVR